MSQLSRKMYLCDLLGIGFIYCDGNLLDLLDSLTVS